MCWWWMTPARTVPATSLQIALGQEPRLHLIRRSGKLGLGTAYLAGFRHGLDNGYALIFTMDADFSHSPSLHPADARRGWRTATIW